MAQRSSLDGLSTRSITESEPSAPLASPDAGIQAMVPYDLEGGSERQVAEDRGLGTTMWANRVIDELVQECADLAMARQPDLRGVLSLSYGMKKDPHAQRYVLHVEVDEERSTLDDLDLIECVTSNPFGVEGEVENAEELGSFSSHVSLVLPRQESPEFSSWPDDGSSPACPEGSTLAGTQGLAQWCERDGHKHGEHYQWRDGRLVMISVWRDGEVLTGRNRP